MQTETIVKDYLAGQRDKKAGVYDKWYRYNHSDNGHAYDCGFNSIGFTQEIHIIECTYSFNNQR